MSDLKSTVQLNNGILMPRFGLGVWKSSNTDAKNAVKTAIKHGYTLIDTAKQYGNETGVGQGIKEGLAETGMNRKDLFVTTKLFNGNQGYESTLRAFDGQLKRLGLHYIDLYLIHWPVDDKFIDTYKAMEKLYHEGKIRALGISNFDNERLAELLEHTDVVPAVNQMEFNPTNQEKDILAQANLEGIQLEAWSPLGGGDSLSDPTVLSLAEKYGKTAAQIILRWEYQRDLVIIPKSIHEQRIVENSQIFDFEITSDDVAKLNALDKSKRGLWYDDFKWHNPDGPWGDSVDKWDDSPANYAD